MAEEKDGWAGVVRGRPQVGQVAERSRTTTMADVEGFTAMTGDKNPLHYDRALAEKTPFGRLIVQGGVTSGILNAVVAEDLPGPGTVFLGVEWKFIKAVGVDETITGRVEVIEVRGDKPIAKLATSVRNAGATSAWRGPPPPTPCRWRGSEPRLQAGGPSPVGGR